MSDQSVDEPVASGQTAVTEQPDQDARAEREHEQAAEEFVRDKKYKQVMHVKIYAPFRTYYDGEAFSISAVNATGPFDILPTHHNFISLLSPCDLVVHTADNHQQKVRIAGGLMHVKADQVIVFLDI